MISGCGISQRCQAARNLAAAIRRHLEDLSRLSPRQLKDERYKKFRGMGVFVESGERDKLS